MKDKRRAMFEIYKKIKNGTATDEENRLFELYIMSACMEKEVIFNYFESLLNQEEVNSALNRKDP